MATLHGINGQIYVSGTELTGANSWSVNVDQDAVEEVKFGDSWKSQKIGARGWSGSVNAYGDNASKLILDAATSGVSVQIIIYPARGDTADSLVGNAVFGSAMDASTTSIFNENGSFVGDGALTIAGFA